MCIGDRCCKHLASAGSIVTVTGMGQHKDVCYPRVKLHDANGEQVRVARGGGVTSDRPTV